MSKLIEIMNEMDEIENLIEKKNYEYFEQVTSNKGSFEGFHLNTINEWKKLLKLRVEYIKVCNFELEDMPDHGDYFPIEKFKKFSVQRYFIDNDGVGYFCVGDKMTDLMCLPSYFLQENADFSRFDGVMWFNK